MPLNVLNWSRVIIRRRHIYMIDAVVAFTSSVIGCYSSFANDRVHQSLIDARRACSIFQNGAQNPLLGRLWYRNSPNALLFFSQLTYSPTGIATRFVQLGIETRPLFQRGSLWVYTLFAGVGGSFGYWMKGVEDRQMKMLQQRKEIIIEKRRRRAERELAEQSKEGGGGRESVGMLASTS